MASMFAARSIRRCRESSGLTLRSLADRAGTSHSTLAAYEAGRKVPNLATWERILHAAGWEPEVRGRARPEAPGADRRGEELEEVLALAGHFPARHDEVLRAPIFGHR
jgi:transcriptional regulator with XRE-family HTH domain